MFDQVAEGSRIAAKGESQILPVGTTYQRRMPRNSAIHRSPQCRGAEREEVCASCRVEYPLDNARGHSWQVEEGDHGGDGRCLGGSMHSCPEGMGNSGGKPGVDDGDDATVHREQRSRVSGCGAQNHEHRVAPRVEHPSGCDFQPRCAGVVSQERFGRAHPGALAGGKHNAHERGCVSHRWTPRHCRQC